MAGTCSGSSRLRLAAAYMWALGPLTPHVIPDGNFPTVVKPEQSTWIEQWLPALRIHRSGNVNKADNVAFPEILGPLHGALKKCFSPVLKPF